MIRALGVVAVLALANPLGAFDHDHAAWTEILKTHVRDGNVDYKALAHDKGPLDAYLRSLEAVTARTFSSFTDNQKLAFWINAYNAYTVKLILDNYPVASIKKIGKFWQSPFKIEFIPLEKLRGETISLDTIEHGILRKEFKQPLIHAAIICASKSCPALISEAYRAADVEAQLVAAMRGFLADSRRNQWNSSKRILELSSIFKWFREDFEGARGTLLAFILDHLPEAVRRDVQDGKEPSIEFLDYDWSLNGK